MSKYEKAVKALADEWFGGGDWAEDMARAILDSAIIHATKPQTKDKER